MLDTGSIAQKTQQHNFNLGLPVKPKNTFIIDAQTLYLCLTFYLASTHSISFGLYPHYSVHKHG